MPQPDQRKDRTEIARRPDTFPAEDVRAAVEVVATRARQSLQQALVTAGANSYSLSAQSICRVCIATAAEVNKIVFTAKQLGEICGSVGKSLSVSPRTGSWESFALAAVAHYKKHTKTTHQDVTVPTGTKDVSETKSADRDEFDYDPNDNDDDPSQVENYGDDPFCVEPETISEPTLELPGSEKKLKIIIMRARLGLPLWVDGDRRE